MVKLDKKIKTSKERLEYVQELLQQGTYTPKELDIMATYMLEASEREEKTKEILTNNRIQTINKRETSWEEMQEFIHSNEMKKHETKVKPLTLKLSLTEEDFKNPFIKQIEDEIQRLKQVIKNAPDAKCVPMIKSILIDLKKTQYMIKGVKSNSRKLLFQKGQINYYQPTGYLSNGEYNDSTFYFHKPKHIAALIKYYDKLLNSDVQSTIHWILIDFDILLESCPNEKYKDIIKWKIQGYENQEIYEMLLSKYSEGYSLMYISSLINKIIPAALAQLYTEKMINWIYLYKLRGKWKKCSKCGQIKLAHRCNFSLNKRGKYGFHSICKLCRREVKKSGNR